MDFLQRTPFFRLLLPLIIGIVLYQYVELYGVSLYALSGLALLLIFLSFVIQVPKRQFQFRWLFGSGIFLFLVVMAYSLSIRREREMVFDHLHQKGIYRVELIAAPIEKTNSYLCKVDVLQFYDSGWKQARGQAVMYFQKDSRVSNLLFGDRLMVEAEFVQPEKAMNPDGFDYAAYLKRQGVGGTCYVSSDSWRAAGRNEAFSIRRAADKCQKYLLKVYKQSGISGDEFAVLAALTLGYTDDLQPDIKTSYSAAGVTHVLSVSGMHLALVYGLLLWLLGFLNKTRRQKVFKGLFIIVFLWAYAFLTGLSAAVVRAALMFSMLSLATCFDRKSLIYNTIFASAFLMLIYNPNFLFDVGFQLSYSAVLSIIFFKPMIDKFYKPTNKVNKFAWDTFSVSVVAQLGTMPFTLYYFQRFPNYFLFTNFIAIPLSGGIIYGAIGLLFVSWIPYVYGWVGFLLKWLLWALNHFLAWVEGLPYSVSHISLDLRQMMVLFLALFCFSGYYYTRKFLPLFLGLCSLLLACVFDLQVNYNTLTTKRMIVYAGRKNTHVSFISGNRNEVFSTDTVEAEKIGKAFWQNQKLSKVRYVNGQTGFRCFEGQKVLILTDEWLKRKTTFSPIRVDYLIVGKGVKPRMDEVLDCVQPRKVVVDKSVSRWYADHIRQVCESRRIGFYSIASEGAYVLSIKD